MANPQKRSPVRLLPALPHSDGGRSVRPVALPVMHDVLAHRASAAIQRSRDLCEDARFHLLASCRVRAQILVGLTRSLPPQQRREIHGRWTRASRRDA